MSIEATTFHCELRQRAGTGGSRAVRRDGFVPGVLYGGDQEPANIKLRYNEILKAHQTGRLIDVLSNIVVDGKPQQVIGRDIQLHPVKDLPMHVDLMRVSSKTRVTVNVPVRFLNEEECPGIKEGGVLNVVRYEIELVCPATNIPEALEVDLAEAEVGDTIHVSTITIPSDAKLTITDRDFTVATIAAPTIQSEPSDEDDETIVTEGPEGAVIDTDERDDDE